MFLDFLDPQAMPLAQVGHMGPKQQEIDFGEILDLTTSKIEAQGTLSESHGTKKIVSKIVSCHPHMMLFYVFLWFVLQKMEKIIKNKPFLVLLTI